MTELEKAARMALEALESYTPCDYSTGHVIHPSCDEDAMIKAITALTAALEQPAPVPEAHKQEPKKTMPITDDHGQPTQPQYRVVEQIGKWFLLYDQHQIGNTVKHEFRIQKLKHDIALYPGITLAEAQKRFLEKVQADHE